MEPDAKERRGSSPTRWAPMKHQYALVFLVSAVASALIWALSPLLTGHAEPWDAYGPFDVGSLVVAGLGAS